MNLLTMGKGTMANGLGGSRETIPHIGLSCLDNITVGEDA